MRLSKRSLRLPPATVVLLSSLTVTAGYVGSGRTNDRVTGHPAVEWAFRSGGDSPIVGNRSVFTTAATDSRAFVSDECDADWERADENDGDTGAVE